MFISTFLKRQGENSEAPKTQEVSDLDLKVHDKYPPQLGADTWFSPSYLHKQLNYPQRDKKMG